MAQGDAFGAAMGSYPDLAHEANANAGVRERLERSLKWYHRRQSATNATGSSDLHRSSRLGRLASAALIVVTFAYLCAELAWNLNMLETMSRPGSTRVELQAMAMHGRMLAAFGLVWALIRSLLFSRKSGIDALVNYVLFASSLVVAHASIGTGYDKAIDSLSPSTSMRAFELAAHRGWAMKRDLEPDRQARVAAAITAPTTVALWGVYVSDPVVLSDARAEYESRRAGLSEDAITTALERYPEIAAARKKLQSGEANAKLAEFERQYAEYVKKSSQVLNPPVGLESARRIGIESFAAATCGMLPIENATREQFAKELTKSCVNNWRDGGKAYLGGVAQVAEAASDPIVFDDRGIKVRLSEVINLDEAGFTAFVRDRAAGMVDEQLPTEATVKTNLRAHDVIASVIVPPMSMMLSMLGIVANAGGIFALLLGLKRYQGLAAAGALAAAAVFVPATAPTGMPKAWAAFERSSPFVAFVASKVVTAEQALLAAKRGLQ